jgi:hypothetical protein
VDGKPPIAVEPSIAAPANTGSFEGKRRPLVEPPKGVRIEESQ